MTRLHLHSCQLRHLTSKVLNNAATSGWTESSDSEESHVQQPRHGVSLHCQWGFRHERLPPRTVHVVHLIPSGGQVKRPEQRGFSTILRNSSKIAPACPTVQSKIRSGYRFSGCSNCDTTSSNSKRFSKIPIDPSSGHREIRAASRSVCHYGKTQDEETDCHNCKTG